jgi:transglutaminase-like putative cysteine protease
MTHANLARYLEPSPIIDFDHPDVARTAQELAAVCRGDVEIAGRCFLFVRDEIFHSWDHKMNPVTLKASDVLRYRTGFCYAKSHLLAALLRANGIPAGLCYQRLVSGEFGQPFFLHGLNAVWFEEYGWYRADARGIKPLHDAAFTPPVESLPYVARAPGEAELPEIWADPIPQVMDVLTRYGEIEAVRRHLPDLELVLPAGTEAGK